MKNHFRRRLCAGLAVFGGLFLIFCRKQEHLGLSLKKKLSLSEAAGIPFYSGFLGEELASWAEVKRDQTIFIDQKRNFYLLALGSMELHVFHVRYQDDG